MLGNFYLKCKFALRFIFKNRSLKGTSLIFAMTISNIMYALSNKSRKYSDKTIDHHEVINPLATYAPWNSDEEFLKTYEKIRRYTLVDVYRCYELWDLVEQSAKLEGALIEIGSWRGGSGALIAKRSQLSGIKDNVYLCDTFEGVVNTSERDSYYRNAVHSDTSKENVESMINQLGLGNCRVIPGMFPRESEHLIADDKFRFCHIDVDVYESAMDTINWIWDKLVVGGIVVYDDYGFLMTDGITSHVNSFKKTKDLLSIYNLNGHSILIKQK